MTKLPPSPQPPPIAGRGSFRLGHGHGVGLADALIAAAAARHQAQLVTLNARRFPMVEVEVGYAKLTYVKLTAVHRSFKAIELEVNKIIQCLNNLIEKKKIHEVISARENLRRNKNEK